MPTIVSKDDNIHKDNIKINTEIKYLLISNVSSFDPENSSPNNNDDISDKNEDENENYSEDYDVDNDEVEKKWDEAFKVKEKGATAQVKKQNESEEYYEDDFD